MLNTKIHRETKRRSEGDSYKNYLKFIIVLPFLCTKTADNSFTGGWSSVIVVTVRIPGYSVQTIVESFLCINHP
jgi:hypothetical protein